MKHHVLLEHSTTALALLVLHYVKHVNLESTVAAQVYVSPLVLVPLATFVSVVHLQTFQLTFQKVMCVHLDIFVQRVQLLHYLAQSELFCQIRVVCPCWIVFPVFLVFIVMLLDLLMLLQCALLDTFAKVVLLYHLLLMG